MTIRSCVHCGCTDDRACMTAAGPCSWVTLDPPVCSACVDIATEELGRDEPEDATGQACAALTVPGPHKLVWTGETACYCFNCRMGFAA